MKNKFIPFSVIISLLFLIFSCKKESTVNIEEIKSSAVLDSIASKYYNQYLQFYPLEATAQGENKYNDLLTNTIDSNFISKEISFYKSIQEELKNLNYNQLPEDDKVVYDVLDYTLKDKIERYTFHPEYIPFTQFGGLPLDFPLLGSGDGNQPFKNDKDYDNWLRRMEKFPDWMDTAIANFKIGIQNKQVLPKKLVVKMIAQMKGEEIINKNLSKNIFYGPIRNLSSNLTVAQKENYRTLYKDAINNKIIPSYTKMAEFLEKEYLPNARDTDGIGALPNGKDAYNYYAKSWTTTNTNVEDINKIGVQQVNMLRAEMEKVKETVGFKGTLEEFLTDVKTNPKAMPYKTAKEVIDSFNGILKTIDPKLKTMFSVTPKTGFEIRQTEKFREATASAEYIPGTPDGKRKGIFYIPIPDPTKINVTSGMESLFLHEAIPGHHYQVSLQQENTKIPKFMRFGWFGAYGEGWAHYCETLGPELGLYTDPYQKMGYLSDQMLRAVRLVIDTGLHTGTMNREEAIKYFLNNVAYDEAGATAEVERYMAMPGQALGYKIGALKIRELREKYSKDLGKKFNLAEFHDEILSQGCLPLSVLERKMTLWAKSKE
ncbi:DUF885 domain-containing protein [Frigoriflavimonas asaccharolytica]|uniref:Uncharacterized protein (DUF885 family) n=1 Tax=Frigoriflavimonas asaccharolytica TaxID=2735899 RepID=A0A8J8K6K9_9FLAO|nr:DUF885 domain-containing protein [Frigoriflavimonas asaccharolytica]NRS91068.1 uncharacterized protein (DUF885 family) [Frigoriflavimonas asaccharolytica]